MFKKIFKFQSGYVIIEIVGKNKERFVNMCLTNGFRIWDVTPAKNGLVMKIRNADFLKIRRLVRKCKVRIKILEKYGAGVFVKKHRYRVMVPVTGLLVCIYFLIVPQYIWCVEIEGAKNADTEKIEKILLDKGVYIGARKKNIADLGEIKNAVIFGDEEVNWAWLYLEGAKARLVVQERTPPPAVYDKTTPTTLIAGHDGFVRVAEVRRGERRVVAGDTVSKGDVLVSGKVAVFHEGYPEKYSYVNSDARIIADTVHTKTGEFSAKETLRIRTGQKKRRVSFQLFGKEYTPFGSADEAFPECDVITRNYDATVPIFGYLGFGMSIHDVYEIKEHKNVLTEDEVLARAKEKLEERICKEVGTEAQKTEEKLTYSVDGDTYTVTLRINFRENIGIKIPQEE
ncbi:MAG: sporulation protein YqfD [Clostridia bacterium]|nr:sporulation protein YqfD [Clostridia bacterium]